MEKDERQKKIVQILQEREYASVSWLSKNLFASPPTIRRDLNMLENEGYIIRCRGGAALPGDTRSDIPLLFRKTTKSREKKQLCKMASVLVKNGDVIFLDASTTAQHMVEYLKNKQNIKVVTNSLITCGLLYQNDIETFCTGGKLRKNSGCFVGRRAEEYVGDFNADIMFFSTSALNTNGLVSDYSDEETYLRQAMFKHSDKKVFLCDSTKLGKNSTYRTCMLDELDFVATDFDSGTDFSAFQCIQKQEGCYLFSKMQ